MSRLDLKCKCREVCPHDAAMTVWATPSAHRVFLYISSVTGTQEMVLDENGIRKLISFLKEVVNEEASERCLHG